MLISIYDKAVIDINELCFAQGKTGHGHHNKILELYFKNGSVQTINFYETDILTADAITLIDEAIQKEYKTKNADKLDILELQNRLKKSLENGQHWNKLYCHYYYKYLETKKKSERFTAKRKPSKNKLLAEIKRLEKLIQTLHKNKGE